VKPGDRFFIPNVHVYRTDFFPGLKGGTAVAVRKGILHNRVNLPLLFSVETTGVCISIGSSEILLVAVLKSPGRTWSDADVIALLNFRSLY
jgi:hypothetical protein